MEASEYEGLVPLVDGDIIVFRSGMAGQYTMRDVYSPKDKKVPIISFRYVKLLNQWLKEHNKTRDDFIIVDRPVQEPLNRILHTTKLMMKAIEEKFKGGKPKVYLTGGNNFRDEYATEMPYKGNRWSEEKRQAARDAGKWIEWLDATEEKHVVPTRPFYEKEIKAYLTKYWSAELIEGEEADDALGIEQYKMQVAYRKDNTKPRSIIVSVDKDLKMIAGYHQDVSAMDLDPELIDTVTADRNFYSQLLSGDRVDNIPGIKGIGKAKGDKVVAECNTPKEMLDAVLKVYEEKELDVSRETILYRGRLLWIRRKEEQLWEML